MKAITPVISVILLIMLTIATSAAAFFFINSSVTDLEAQGNLESFPGSDNSRLNLVSITGTKAIVRNDGTTPVTEVVMFVNGELLNYTLDNPILPGEYKEIDFTARESGEDLEIKVIYNTGKTVSTVSPASKNTEDSGFTQTPIGLNEEISQYFLQCPDSSVIANLDNTRILTQSSNITCGCTGPYGENFVTNGDFENGTWMWDAVAEEEIIEENGNHILLFTEEGYDNLLPADVLEFNLNYSNEGMYMVAILIINTSDPFYDNNLMAYVLTNIEEYSSLCNSIYEGLYFSCITADANSWQNISLNIKNDLLNYLNLNIYDIENIKIQFQNGAGDYAVIDNVSLKYSTDYKYCDSENDGVLEGVCNSLSCSNLMINSLTTPSYNFIYSPSYFNASLSYFNSPSSCTINLEGETHDLAIAEDSIYYSQLFDAGNYSGTATLSCDSESEQFNYSFSSDRYSNVISLNEMINYNETGLVSFSAICNENNVFISFNNQSGSLHILNSSNKGETLSEPIKIFNYPVSDESSLRYTYNNNSLFFSYFNQDTQNLSIFNSSVNELSFDNL
ncbi:MAG: hypothetical protein PHN56_03385, partial [Candidatus Nanoarchaeia archaeon]|nr:hypothetical protein [Candidatus Nanoarchaeia archaeon]